ncbi:MAG: exodeoxyribonuclease VII small subunit [Bacillota bacterium]
MLDKDKMIGDKDAVKAPEPEEKGSLAIELQDEMDFAETMKRLEHIVKSLESGALSLEDSLKGFEEGIRLARHLESILDRAERKVQEILNQPDGVIDGEDLAGGDV